MNTEKYIIRIQQTFQLETRNCSSRNNRSNRLSHWTCSMPLLPFFRNGFVQPHKAATAINQTMSTINTPMHKHRTKWIIFIVHSHVIAILPFHHSIHPYVVTLFKNVKSINCFHHPVTSRATFSKLPKSYPKYFRKSYLSKSKIISMALI